MSLSGECEGHVHSHERGEFYMHKCSCKHKDSREGKCTSWIKNDVQFTNTTTTTTTNTNTNTITTTTTKTITNTITVAGIGGKMARELGRRG
jgi:hypothetical protein